MWQDWQEIITLLYDSAVGFLSNVFDCVNKNWLMLSSPGLLKLSSDEVRLPLVKITEETKEAVRSAMSHANLI